MKYRRFGKTELQLPVLTFGAMQLPAVDEDEAIRVVRRAVELGINHIETARGYGNSEVRVGKAIRGLDRERLLITTKIGPTETADEMRRSIDESLTRMGIGWIDNFDFHGINTRESLERVLKPGGCFKAVRQARDEGLIRHVGFSCHAPLDVLLDTINTEEFESVNLHYYYAFQRNLPAVERAAELDMGILIISPSDKGGQLYKPSARIVELCRPFTPLYLNHRFNLSNPAITTQTCGASHPHEFDDHLEAAEHIGPLTDDEQAAIARLDAAKTGIGHYCSECFECLPCPENIQIPEVLRLRNLARAFDLVGYGQYRYKQTGAIGDWYPGAKGDRCTDCGDCLPRCPLNLPIPALLRETHAMLESDAKGRRRFE